MPHLVIIEDDPAIRTSLARSLGDRGHAVTTAATGMTGLQEVLDQTPDLVVLDLGLPDLDGHRVLSMLRAVQQTPVIVVTARDDDVSVVRALDAGADDYVVKPFAVDQLEARIRAVLRRTGDDAPRSVITVGALTINVAARVVTLEGRTLDLSRREFDLLQFLAERAGQVVTKREMLAEVWHQVYGGGERTVDVHLSWLRRKLGESAAAPVFLHSVRGVGVRLMDPRDNPAES